MPKAKEIWQNDAILQLGYIGKKARKIFIIIRTYEMGEK